MEASGDDFIFDPQYDGLRIHPKTPLAKAYLIDTMRLSEEVVVRRGPPPAPGEEQPVRGWYRVIRDLDGKWIASIAIGSWLIGFCCGYGIWEILQ